MLDAWDLGVWNYGLQGGGFTGVPGVGGGVINVNYQKFGGRFFFRKNKRLGKKAK